MVNRLTPRACIRDARVAQSSPRAAPGSDAGRGGAGEGGAKGDGGESGGGGRAGMNEASESRSVGATGRSEGVEAPRDGDESDATAGLTLGSRRASDVGSGGDGRDV